MARLLVIALTVSRILLALALVLAILESSARSVGWLALVVLFDIADGVMARMFNADDWVRRLLDVVVDKLTIHAAFIAACTLDPRFFSLYAPILVRDCLVMGGYWHLLFSRRVQFRGTALHKLGSLSCAFVGAAWITGDQAALWWTGLGAILANWILLIDLAGLYFSVLRRPAIPGPGEPVSIMWTRGWDGIRSVTSGRVSWRPLDAKM